MIAMLDCPIVTDPGCDAQVTATGHLIAPDLSSLTSDLAVRILLVRNNTSGEIVKYY